MTTLDEVDQQLLDVVNNLKYPTEDIDMSSPVNSLNSFDDKYTDINNNPQILNPYENSNQGYERRGIEPYFNNRIFETQRASEALPTNDTYENEYNNDFRQHTLDYSSLTSNQHENNDINKRDYFSNPQIRENSLETRIDPKQIELNIPDFNKEKNKPSNELINFDNLDLDENDIEKIINGDKEIPSFFDILKIYLDHITYEIYPHGRKCKNKFFIFLIRIVQLIAVFFVIFGFMLPSKLLKYHIICCVLLLITHELLNGKSLFSLLVEKVGNYQKYQKLIPLDSSDIKTFVLLIMFISIFGLIVPNYSVFSILYKLFSFLNKSN